VTWRSARSLATQTSMDEEIDGRALTRTCTAGYIIT